jgi:hypothetical protein
MPLQTGDLIWLGIFNSNPYPGVDASRFPANSQIPPEFKYFGRGLFFLAYLLNARKTAKSEWYKKSG